MTIPGIGAVTAAALTALAPPADTFRRGRDFAAWLGLTPVQRSSGGKERLGKTSKMGERSLRRLLIIGASAVARWAARKGVHVADLVTTTHVGSKTFTHTRLAVVTAKLGGWPTVPVKLPSVWPWKVSRTGSARGPSISGDTAHGVCPGGVGLSSLGSSAP